MWPHRANRCGPGTVKVNLNRRQWIVAVMLFLAVCAAAPGGDDGPAAASRPASTSPSSDEAELRPPSPPAGAAENLEDKSVRSGKGRSGGGWLRTIAALALVIALILLVKYLLGRSGLAGRAAGGRAGPFDLVARMNIAPKSQLLLVRLGGRLLLIGTGPDGPRMLSEITDPGEIERLGGTVRTAGGDKTDGSTPKNTSDVSSDES